MRAGASAVVVAAAAAGAGSGSAAAGASAFPAAAAASAFPSAAVAGAFPSAAFPSAAAASAFPSAAAAAAGAAPADALWHVRIDPLADPVRTDPVVVTGTARHDVLRVDTVTVTIAPVAGMALPPACGPLPARQVPVAADRFDVEVTPRCNGTYVMRATARASTVSSSSPPVERTVAVERPGPAPAAPRVSATAGTVRVDWASASAPPPDLAGYRLEQVDGAGTVIGASDVPALVTSTTLAARPGGTYAFRIRDVRWGRGGPGSTGVASGPSQVAAVRLADPAAPDAGPQPRSWGDPPAGRTPETGAALLPGFGAGRAPLARSGPTAPAAATAPPTTLDTGYRPTLPYGRSARAGTGPGSSLGAASPDGARALPAGARVVDRRVPMGRKFAGPALAGALLALLALLAGWLARRAGRAGVGRASG
ncbi:MAG: hypothetical protein HYX34_14085 [Actinobacteria bacterium]|nr:hypothetical protein [Actinomycetota bacterium]